MLSLVAWRCETRIYEHGGTYVERGYIWIFCDYLVTTVSCFIIIPNVKST